MGVETMNEAGTPYPGGEAAVDGAPEPAPDGAPDVAASTVERVLSVALRIVDEQGEAGLRIGDVVEQSGVSVGSVYHHFGDRNGLVEAVRVEQFRGQVESDVAAIARLADVVTTREEFIEGLCLVARASADPTRADNRWRRVSVIGAARRRPQLARSIANMQAPIRDELAALIASGQQRGIVRGDADPAALASFVQAYTLGKILTELGPGTEVDMDGWVHVVRLLAEALVPTD